MIEVPAGLRQFLKVPAKLSGQSPPQRKAHGLTCAHMPVEGLGGHDLGEALMVAEVVVVGKLVPDPEADHQGDPHADAEAEGVDEGIPFAFQEIAPGDLKIVSEHAECLEGEYAMY